MFFYTVVWTTWYNQVVQEIHRKFGEIVGQKKKKMFAELKTVAKTASVLLFLKADLN